LKNLLTTTLAIIGLTVLSYSQVPNYVPTNGLVGWWPFNGNANDESGNGNNGVVNGASLTTDRFGNVNTSYSFNGLTDFITVLQNSNLSPTEAITLAAWVNIDPTIDFPFVGIINKELDAYPSYASYQLITGNSGLNETGDPGITIITSNSYEWTGVTGASFLNQWVYLVGTYDGNQLKCYHNGNLVSTISQNGTIQYSNTNVEFGRRTNNNATGVNTYFKGEIDDVGIWNRALNQQEITELYNAQNCSNNLSISPVLSQLQTGSTANFIATSSDQTPSFQWQSDFGQGYVSLNNYGNYSGVNTNSLSISNVQLSEHNQPIRVISTSGVCVDTSDVAIISITDTCLFTINDTITTFISVTDTLIINTTITSLAPPNNFNTIQIFPNPVSDHITIDYGNFALMNGYQLTIENSLGQQVFQTNISQQSDYLTLSNWGGNGLYFVHIIDTQGNTIDVRKIILQ
jgi:hypothetical protein